MYSYGDPVMHGGDYGWGFGMMLVYLLLLALLAAVVIHFLRGHHSHLDGSKPTALDIVNERYAKGDITKAEFDQLKKDLK
jgi:putative membrane protein